MDFSNFIPTTTLGWVCYVVIAVLLIAILLYNKAILKCKTLIEDYVSEIRTLKETNMNLSEQVTILSNGD